jgi:hypothetical protein
MNNSRTAAVTHALVLVCTLLPVSAWAGSFETLAGDLPEVLRNGKSPYLVNSDIYVPAGKTVVIEAGCVLMFKNFTGLHAQGTLLVRGTSKKPVIFTSEYDPRFNRGAALQPNPYDWNGIFIHNDAIGTDLQHFELAYSVYGINTQTRFIRITEAMFKDNGRSNLTIEGKLIPVSSTLFSYSLSVKNAAVDGVPVKILSDPDAQKRNIMRYSGLSLAIGGASMAAVFTSKWTTSRQRVNDIRNDLVANDATTFDNAQKERDRNLGYMIAGYALGVLGACGFSVSFLF